jgi:hypothetical protein
VKLPAAPSLHRLREMPGWQDISNFRFQPRWKEELVCTSPGGTIVLELPMGVLSAYLPTEAAWKHTAPAWSRDLWPVLRSEIEARCKANKTKFIIDETADVNFVSG